MQLPRWFRRFAVRNHLRVHARVDAKLRRADLELEDLEVRIRRLELEKQLRARDAGGGA